MLRLGEFPPVVPVCSSSLILTAGSYERKDLADRSDANIALNCVNQCAAVFFSLSFLFLTTVPVSDRLPGTFPTAATATPPLPKVADRR